MQETSTNWFLQHPQSASIAALVSCCGLKNEVTLKIIAAIVAVQGDITCLHEP
jgi:hypothetical protein